MKSWIMIKKFIQHITNEGIYVVAERFIRTLKNKIYKYMTSISKDKYVDKLDNTYHSAIKMNPVNVKSSKYIDFNKKDYK